MGPEQFFKIEFPRVGTKIIFFSFHSLRAGFLCSALLKAANGD